MAKKPIVDVSVEELNAGVEAFFKEYAMPLMLAIKGVTSPGSSIDVENEMMQMCSRMFDSDVTRVAGVIAEFMPTVEAEFKDANGRDADEMAHILTTLTMGVMIGLVTQEGRE